MKSFKTEDYIECVGLYELLMSWDFEWFVTLTFPRKMKEEEIQINAFLAKKSLRWWTRNICKTEGIQVGYAYALSFIGSHPRDLDDHPHFHLLMLGRSYGKNEGKTLLHVDPATYEKWWRRNEYGAKIRVVESQMEAARYVAFQKLKHRHSTVETDFYNTKLLKKTKLNSVSVPRTNLLIQRGERWKAFLQEIE